MKSTKPLFLAAALYALSSAQPAVAHDLWDYETRDGQQQVVIQPTERPAGMYSEEDLAGKVVGGYEIELGRQIFPFYSDSVEDYLVFDSSRVPQSARDNAPRYRQFGSDLENGIRGPFYYDDLEFREQIKADDSLTVDEKLEIIIKSHQGYMANLDIDDLIEEKIEFVDDVVGRVVDRYYEGEYPYQEETRANRSHMTGGLVLMDTVVVYDDFLYIGYNESEGVDYVLGDGREVNSIELNGQAPGGYQLAIKVARAYEILRHRFSEYSDVFVSDDENELVVVKLKSNWETIGASLSHRNSLGVDMSVMSVGYGHYSLEKVEEYLDNLSGRYPEDYIQGYTQNEQLLSTIFHETLHQAITLYLLDDLPWVTQEQQENMKLWQDNTLEYGDQTNTSNRPNIKYVEMNNYLNEARLAELLNFSPWNRGISLEGVTAGLMYFDNNPNLVEPEKHFFVIR